MRRAGLDETDIDDIIQGFWSESKVRSWRVSPERQRPLF
jgi:hypothetical protein